MSPTPLTAALLAFVAAAVLIVPPAAAVMAAVAIVAAATADAMSVRNLPAVSRDVPRILSRGVRARLSVSVSGSRNVRLRQPVPADIAIEPAEADGELHAQVVAGRRGRHALAPVAVRVDGPLRLGRWYHRAAGTAEVLVYPDMPAAHGLADAVRRGRFREPGHLPRGPLGLGTEFESIREYVPDDDVRRVNWKATARLGRPMSNQYRIEQDRDIICLLDTGRLMSAPVGMKTRLDEAVDAVAAVALVADEVGDRCGVVAFDAAIRRSVRPRRRGASAIVEAVFDLEPSGHDSDFELAFRAVSSGKRSLILVFTDLLEEAAARPLVAATPVLARHHFMVVASVSDPDLTGIVARPPATARQAYESAAAVDVLSARSRVAERLRASGARVLEAAPGGLASGCVGAYLDAKRRARM